MVLGYTAVLGDKLANQSPCLFTSRPLRPFGAPPPEGEEEVHAFTLTHSPCYTAVTQASTGFDDFIRGTTQTLLPHLTPEHAMRHTLLPSLLFGACLITASPAQACGDYGSFQSIHAQNAVFSSQPETQDQAIQNLRALGQPGLDAFLETWAVDFEKIATGEMPETDPHAARLIQTAERIAAQKDAHLSKLFWHTDLQAAQHDGRVSGKAVLVLRLLGNLDESLSCANSRMFRAVLYPDPKVQEALRENYVLCWLPVRTAPVMSVDFGDGRKIERTITGNSLHAVLDHDDGVVDIMPGLVSPEVFTGWLTETAQRVTSPEPLPVVDSSTTALAAPRVDPDQAAQVAMQRTFSKRVMERPAFDAGLLPQDVIANTGTNASAPNQSMIDLADKVGGAAAMIQNGLLNQPTLMKMIQRETTDVDQQSAILRRLARSITADTGINVLTLQPAARQWLNEQTNRPDLQKATQWVYANVFATPLDDPWMGLALFDTFTGLPNGGRLHTQQHDTHETLSTR